MNAKDNNLSKNKLIHLMFSRVGFLSTSLGFTIIPYLLRKYQCEIDKYRDLSRRDTLTGLYNLSYVIQHGNSMLINGIKISVLILDIDGLKSFNETYGHLIGNKILKQFAIFLSGQVEGFEGIVGRIGGDEFVVLLPINDKENINFIINRIQNNLSKESLFKADDGLCNVKIKCSIGDAILISEDNATMEEILHIADMKMHFNKYQKSFSSLDYGKYEYEIPRKVEIMLQCLAEKDIYTYIHTINVAKYSVSLAKEINMPHEIIGQIYIAGLMHDIGKLFIVNGILRKKGNLTDYEYEIIKSHVNEGITIIKGLGLSQTVIDGTLYHHERYDGKGYPNAINGEDIPLVGRVMQVADAFSAMTIKRVYRQVLDFETAKEELKRNSGTQFNPIMVNKFIEMLNRIDN